MTGLREPEALVRGLAEERVPPEEAAVLAERRERLVLGVARMIRESKGARERRSLVRRWSAVVAAAAVVALGVGVAQHSSYGHRAPELATQPAPQQPNETREVAEVRSVTGTVVLKHSGHGRVVAPGEVPSLTSGDELETAADGFAFVQTERSAIHVQPSTQLSVFPPSVVEERIRLALGRIDLKVSKQPHSTRSVVVETPNTEVIVRGTEFSVTVVPEQRQPVTRVRVTEGAVWVLHRGERELVSVGEEWSSSGGRVQNAVVTPAQAAATEIAPVPSRVRPTRAGRAPTKGVVTGSLGEENRMYQAALEARNRGDDRKALELFSALLTRYPNGHLAEVAQVERMRGFKRLGESNAAQAEARRYLAEHPSGAVRDEARGTALGEQ
jgi:hypothetical protein